MKKSLVFLAVSYTLEILGGLILIAIVLSWWN